MHQCISNSQVEFIHSKALFGQIKTINCAWLKYVHLPVFRLTGFLIAICATY